MLRLELLWLVAAEPIRLGDPSGLKLPKVSLSQGVAATFTVLFQIVGALSVIFVIIGGLRYVLANGEPKDVEAAKNTILYAVIGIIVSLIAYAIVRFVTERVG